MSKATGDKAESVAAKALKKQGYKIIERNWRTPSCEIDIIAKKRSEVIFVEVKYRGSQQAGTGLDYITPQKVSSMQKAAHIWVQTNRYSGPYSLAAIEVAGSDFKASELVFV